MTEEFIWLFLLNTTCSLILTGIIWFLQIVHYPSLPRFYRAEFKRHHRFTTTRISFVAFPVMIFELASSVILVTSAEELFFYHLTGLIIVILIWLSSIFIQLPIHFRLQKDGFDDEHIRKLTDTNWLRTLLWSAKSIVALQAMLMMITS